MKPTEFAYPAGFTLPHCLTELPIGTPLLVGFSGGADSCLLLSLLSLYGKETNTPIYAAHLHHGIRGLEADRDRDFCIETAKAYGIPLFVKEVDIPALSQASGRGLELEARLARYAFFDELMTAHHIPVLATAHHADDQLETLLLRLMRGTGTRGLGGIHPVRQHGQGLVIRPLLSLSKQDILSECERRHLSYVTDSTNEKDLAERNKLRHSVIPVMKEIAPQDLTRSALRLSQNAREDEDGHYTQGARFGVG